MSFRLSAGISEGVADADVHAPVEVTDRVFVAVEHQAVTRTEVELQSERDVELVLDAAHGVDTELAPVAVDVVQATMVYFAPPVAKARAAADEPVETAGGVGFIQEVDVCAHGAEGRGPTAPPIGVAGTDGELLTRIDLDGEVAGREGLVAEGLHVAQRDADTVSVRSLCIGNKGEGKEHHQYCC